MSASSDASLRYPSQGTGSNRSLSKPSGTGGVLMSGPRFAEHRPYGGYTTAHHRPVHIGVQPFTRNARYFLYVRAPRSRDTPHLQPVLNVLA